MVCDIIVPVQHGVVMSDTVWLQYGSRIHQYTADGEDHFLARCGKRVHKSHLKAVEVIDEDKKCKLCVKFVAYDERLS